MKIKITKASCGLFRIEKEYQTQRTGTGNDITGPYWMLIQVDSSKPVQWRVNKTFIPAPANPAVIYVPPYSWTAERVSAGTHTKVIGYISNLTPPSYAPTEPCFLSTDKQILDFEKDPNSFFRSSKKLDVISVCTNPKPIAVRAKKIIDRDFSKGILLGDVARRLKTSSALISREFKQSFSFPPKYYERGLRVTHAMFLLMTGESPADAALKAGYRDLGRFYKQFGQYMSTTPKSHHIKKSKNAKK